MKLLKVSLKTALQFYYDIQGLRIRTSGRMHVNKEGYSTKGDHPVLEGKEKEMYEKMLEGLKNNGKVLLKYIKKLVHDHPLWNGFLKDVKGVGELMAGVIISSFDPYKETVSKWWQYAGLNPGMVKGRKMKDGKPIITDTLIRGDRLTKDFLSPFNTWLRAKLLGVLGPSFLKSKSPYSEFYYDYKFRWLSANKGKSDMHRHKAAMRYMIKMFLIDPHKFWRGILDLPVRASYSEEYLGHKHDDHAAN